MNILVSNDDGIFALGIRTLANTIAQAGHTVTVVCPDRERSATGHGLTIHKPIRAEQIEGVFHSDVKAWACSGTPSDCVKLALGAILPGPPDYVLSGINHGGNLGTDVLYSGTVSAAMEGLIEGIPAIAFSLSSFAYQNFQPAADFAVKLLAQLEQHPLAQPMLLNVNIPPVEASAIQGVKVTQQGVRRYFDLFEKRTDPRGKTYYWLAGELLEETEDDLNSDRAELRSQPVSGSFASMKGGTVAADVHAIRENYITITPLQYNLTCFKGIAELETRHFVAFNGATLHSAADS